MIRWLIVHWPVLLTITVCATPFVLILYLVIRGFIAFWLDEKQAQVEADIRREFDV